LLAKLLSETTNVQFLICPLLGLHRNVVRLSTTAICFVLSESDSALAGCKRDTFKAASSIGRGAETIIYAKWFTCT